MENLFENYETEIEDVVINDEAQNQSAIVDDGKTIETEKDKKKERADFFKAKKEIEEQKQSLIEENKRLKAKEQSYQKVVKELGYDGEVDEIEITLESEKSGKSVEEIKSQKRLRDEEIAKLADAKAEELVASKLEKKEIEKLVAVDFASIREKYPDGQIREEKLKAFAVLRSNGIGAVEAFEILEKPTSKESKKSVSTGSTEVLWIVEKEFYSKAEVDKMSEAEVRKNFSKIEKSMEMW